MTELDESLLISALGLVISHFLYQLMFGDNDFSAALERSFWTVMVVGIVYWNCRDLNAKLKSAKRDERTTTK